MEIEFMLQTTMGVVITYHRVDLSEDGIRGMMLSPIPLEVREALARQEKLAMKAVEIGMATEAMLEEMRNCSIIAGKCIFDASWLVRQSKKTGEWIKSLTKYKEGFTVRSPENTRGFSMRIVG